MIGLAGADVGVNDQQSLVVTLNTTPTVGFEPHYTCSWAEFNDIDTGANAVDIRSVLGELTGAGVQVLIESPAAGRQRQAKWIGITNFDSVIHDIQIFLRTITLDKLVCWVELEPGEQLHYIDTKGFYVMTRDGSLKTIVVPKQQISKEFLSGSTNGRPIAVAATATPGTLIHTTANYLALPAKDEIWLWVNNRTAAAATLTIEFGGVATSDHIVGGLSVPANSAMVLVCQGLILLTPGLDVRAFSGTANSLNISGYVNRISN